MTYTPPAPRHYRNTYERTPAASRRLISWLTLATLYIAIPAAVIAAIWLLNTTATHAADRATAAYQQTTSTPLQ